MLFQFYQSEPYFIENMFWYAAIRIDNRAKRRSFYASQVKPTCKIIIERIGQRMNGLVKHNVLKEGMKKINRCKFKTRCCYF